MPRIGVVLSGCGVRDGSEIHEAVLLLLAIERLGAQAVCFAPNRMQEDVVDHLSMKPVPSERNVLSESARLARGSIQDIEDARADDLDAVILPGGFGVVKNLCSFAKDGANCKVDPGVERLLRQAHAAGKPIGAACIAPVVLARLFGDERPRLTIGTDAEIADVLEAMGARPQDAAAAEVVVDPAAKVASTPCYMVARSISEVAGGMEALVKAVLKLAAAPAAR